MNSAEFNHLIKDVTAVTSGLLISKGAEYSSDFDRLANFKRNADLLGLSPLQVWSVYFSKHIDAIHSYMKRAHSTDGVSYSLSHQMRNIDAQVSEPIEGRFHDAINYLYLGLALMEEVKSFPAPISNPQSGSTDDSSMHETAKPVV